MMAWHGVITYCDTLEAALSFILFKLHQLGFSYLFTTGK
jgi:hypothetical protein